MSRIPTVSVICTLAIAAVGVAVAVAFADTPPLDKTPLTDWDPVTAQRDIDAARTAVSRPQTTYLEEFNSGRRSIDRLEVGELAAEFGPSVALEDAAATADAIVVATVQNVFYFGSGMQDVPGTRVTYRITKAIAGPLRPGDTIERGFIGGPYRQPTGEEVFLQAAQDPIDRVGDRVLLMLKRDDAGVFKVFALGAKYELRGGKVVAERTEQPPERVAWAGRPESELLDRVTELARR